MPYVHRACELAPQDPAIQKHASTLHGLRDDWAQAVLFCERRVAIAPHDADALSDLGFAYQSNDQSGQAQTALRQALEYEPTHLDALLNLGDLLVQQGALEQAASCFHQAQSSHPKSLRPLAQRALLNPGQLNALERAQLRSALDEQDQPDLSRVAALFALAQVNDASGDYAEAAACLLPANALAGKLRHAGGQHYNADSHTRYVDQLIETFTPELFEKFKAAGDPSAQPVFVFGMPRSGTTMIEQVLSSHSRIHGAGELPLMRYVMDQLPVPADMPQALQSAVQSLHPANLHSMAADYLAGMHAVLARQGTDAAPHRVIDKMPDNYLYLGMIALLFPRATLIHVRRDVRDVAVSCWQTCFRSMRWADDMHNLAGRIQNYHRLEQHWRAVLPHRLHEVHYEALVQDFEPQARQLVTACGVDWEPACLAFHQNTRPVRTASLRQVRQPLYRQSLARWRRYEPYLSDLFKHLPVTRP